jgi:hypothetical protein
LGRCNARGWGTLLRMLLAGTLFSQRKQ